MCDVNLLTINTSKFARHRAERKGSTAEIIQSCFRVAESQWNPFSFIRRWHFPEILGELQEFWWLKREVAGQAAGSPQIKDVQAWASQGVLGIVQHQHILENQNIVGNTSLPPWAEPWTSRVLVSHHTFPPLCPHPKLWPCLELGEKNPNKPKLTCKWVFGKEMGYPWEFCRARAAGEEKTGWWPHKMLEFGLMPGYSGVLVQFFTGWESHRAGTPWAGLTGRVKQQINPPRIWDTAQGHWGGTGASQGGRKCELMSSPAPKLLPHAAIQCSAPFGNLIIQVFHCLELQWLRYSGQWKPGCTRVPFSTS